MGTGSSKSEWEPPEQDLSVGVGGNVDYHVVSARLVLEYHNDDCCFPVLTVTTDSDTLYAMLGEQYEKGYHLLHATRSPGDLRIMNRHRSGQVIVQAFFRKNAEAGASRRYGDSLTWKLLVEKSWFQTYVHLSGRLHEQKRVVHTNNIVESITRNTQNGERLISCMVAGQADPQTRREWKSGMSPFFGVDMFFEVPTNGASSERYMYNIELVPVTATFNHPGIIYFPDIECDWTAVLNRLLGQGWRLIDIYIDVPMIEQLRTPQKQKHLLCLPTTTDALWILEKPISRTNDPTPAYEGTIVEHPVKVKSASHGYGCQTSPDWDHIIRDMGSRGWELACTLETHSTDRPSRKSMMLKSLLFFQRPLQ